MKKISLFMVGILLLTGYAYAQNLAINTSGDPPNPHAILDVQSNNKGVLIPRMSSTARMLIPATKGLLVYDTTTHSFWYNTGIEWKSIAGNEAWLINGNGGTNESHFLGTTDNIALNFKVNNTFSGRIDHQRGNTFIGYRTGSPTTLITENTGFGFEAMSNVTEGHYNTAVGYQSLKHNTTGTENTATGHRSLYKNVTGRYNTATGFWSMYANTTGERNTANGLRALYNNTTGSYNTAVGHESMQGNKEGRFNTATGYLALTSNSGADNNSAFGFAALANSKGYSNTAVGYVALSGLATGTGNTAVGSEAHVDGPNSEENTAIGHRAMYQSIASHSVAVGSYSLYFSRGNENTAIGNHALRETTTGMGNTATGNNCMTLNITGDYNTAFGAGALSANVTGSYNTAIGYGAGVFSNNLTNATAIGSQANVNASNKVRIGNSAVTVIEGQVPFTTPSDGRFKFNVEENVAGLDFILQLRPVTYQFDVKRFDNNSSSAYDEAENMRRTGFIAQEVEKAAMNTGFNFSGIIKPRTEKDHYSLSYDAFVVPLVKAVQEQNKIISEQQQQIDELKKLVQQLVAAKK